VVRELIEINVEFITRILTGISIAALLIIIGYILGKGVKILLVKGLDKLGLEDWLRRFSFGRAIKRTGFMVSEFFGIMASWIIYIVFIILGVYYASSYIGLNDVAKTSILLLNLYVAGFIKALIIIIVSFILIDAFISYIYKSSELRTEMQLLTPVAEYLRILLYIVVVIFAIEQGGVSVEVLTNIITPIIWGLTIAMLLIIAFNIIQLAKSKPRVD